MASQMPHSRNQTNDQDNFSKLLSQMADVSLLVAKSSTPKPHCKHKDKNQRRYQLSYKKKNQQLNHKDKNRKDSNIYKKNETFSVGAYCFI